MGHDHRDLSAEMLFVEPKRFLAVTVIVEVSVQFHCNRLFYWFGRTLQSGRAVASPHRL
jgi:hypothetical protein